MLPLSSLVQQVKRTTGFGDIAVTDDQPTADIVHFINQRRFRLWRRYAWKWIIDTFTLALTANNKDYTIDNDIGDIVAIDNGDGDYLKKRTLKHYLKWQKSSSGSDDGAPTDYMRMGMSSDKSIKIKVWPTPNSAANLDGWGKQRLTRYTVADIATNTDIEFFPEEVIPVLEAGVLADIYEEQGKTTESIAKNNFFNSEMEKMVSEEDNEEDSEEESPPPDYMVFHKRKRGGTTVT